MMKEDIENMSKLMIENKIKPDIDNINIDKNKETKIIHKNLKHKEPRLSQRNLIHGVESKIYHGLFYKQNDKNKALFNARRSNKALSFLNNYIGIDHKNELKINNKDFNNTIRLLYGFPLRDDNDQDI